MSCPIDARLAAAASGEDLAAIAHARDCLRCRGLVEQQRELVAAARALANPPLTPARRAALAAKVMAHGDAVEVPPRWRGERVIALAASVVAAAAVLTLVLARRGVPAVPPEPDLLTAEVPALHVVLRAHLPAIAAPLRASVVASGAELTRALHGGDDVVTLHDGEVSVDATEREPVTIVAGDTRVRIASSRAKVVARRGVIVTTHVFAGSAQVTTRGGKLQIVEAGDVWMHEPEVEAPASPAADSLAAFRIG